jgi:hypothetical protein
MKRITGNTVKAKIRAIAGVDVLRVTSQGGNAFVVYLKDVNDNSKVCFAINRAGWFRSFNNETRIGVEV